jgi:hypothetical protein
MKPSRIFSILGAMVLAISSYFAKGVNSKFSSPFTIYVSTFGGSCKFMNIVASGTFTTGGSGAQATMRTTVIGFDKRKLWATPTCALGAKPVHFHG